jgi:hypothetical protein
MRNILGEESKAGMTLSVTYHVVVALDRKNARPIASRNRVSDRKKVPIYTMMAVSDARRAWGPGGILVNSLGVQETEVSTA